MARLHSAGEFSGPNERAVAERLAAELPNNWDLICNKQITQGDRSRETDLICVASRKVFVIEEKGWSGQIRGTDNSWLVHGELRKSPINQCEMSCKILAGILKDRWRQLSEFGVDLVVSFIVMSAPDVQLNIADSRASNRVFKLEDAANAMKVADRIGGNPPLEDTQSEIVNYLMRLPTRPAIPEIIGQYKITDQLDDEMGCRVYRAEHEDGSKRILKVYYSANTLEQAPTLDTSVRRQYDTQKSLLPDDLCPLVDPYFTWDDGRALVIPFALPNGKSFADLAARGGPSAEQVLPILKSAFESIAKVHSIGIVHRSLRPDRIWWDPQRAKVRFSDFLIARIEGRETVIERADQFDLDHPYRSAECRIDLSAASSKSDIYSLAAVLMNWITGEEPPEDDSWNPGPLIDLRKDFDAGFAEDIENILYPALAIEPADRPTAQDLVSSIAIAEAKQESVRDSLVADQSEVQVALGASADSNRYEILSPLGKGGTAETFLARDHQRDERVVLKRIIRPDVHGYLAKAEFKALHRLQHPCLPHLIDIYGPEEPFHLKFEYTEGQSLRDAWRTLKSGSDEAKLQLVLRIASDILDALSYLHSKNFLHRDVTPGNILLPEDEEQRVLLIDFGLALEQSQAVSRVGTPLYLAPEVEQTIPEWSAKCDLYGLGVLLFELITDRLPYEINGSQRLKRELVDFDDSGDSLKSRLCRLLLQKACCADPGERFSSASEMSQAITAEYRREEEPEGNEESEESAGVPAAAAAPIPPQVKTEHVNGFVSELRQVFRNSTLGNTNNRGMDNDFSRDTYVATDLDELTPDILSGKWKCVALSGNPGDGKTAYLGEVRRALEEAGAIVESSDEAGWRIRLDDHLFVSVYDASESHEGKTSEELLKAAIEPLKGRKGPEAKFTALLAINDGRLQDFITSSRLSYRWLCEALKAQMDGQPSGDESVLLIDLKHRAPVSGTSEGKSIFIGLLDAFVTANGWQECEKCTAFNICPIRNNAAELKEGVRRERLTDLLAGVFFTAERRPTIRDMRSALAWIITGDRDCHFVHADNPPSEKSETRYYNLAFDPSAGEDLVLDYFQTLDPATVAHPKLERLLLRGNAAVEFFGDEKKASVKQLTAASIGEFKRRYYFEKSCVDNDKYPSPSELIPTRNLSLFRELVTGRASLEHAKQRILLGLQRLDRIPPHAAGENELALRLDATHDDLMVVRQWGAEQFQLIVPGTNDKYLNYLPDHLLLRYEDSWPEMLVGLPMFEILMRAADGMTPDASEHQSLLMDFQRFRAQLLTSPTRRVSLVTAGGDRRFVHAEGGKISCEPEATHV